jgi:hypothetical protein
VAREVRKICNIREHGSGAEIRRGYFLCFLII